MAVSSSNHAHFVARDYRIKPVPGRVAVLASGGLDSSVMLARIARRRREVFPVYIRTGLVWEKDELAVLRRFIKALGSIPSARSVCSTLADANWNRCET